MRPWPGGHAGQNFANQAGQNMIGAGNAAAASRIASGNAWGNTLSNLGGIGMDLYGMNMMNDWMGGMGGSGAPNLTVPDVNLQMPTFGSLLYQ